MNATHALRIHDTCGIIAKMKRCQTCFMTTVPVRFNVIEYENEFAIIRPITHLSRF